MINFMAKEDSVARKNGKYLLLFVFCFLVAALQAKSPVYGQAKTFTVSLKNVTLKEVISYVEKNSQYVFFFKPEVINQSTQISVSLKNATVKQLLDKVSEQANIVYEMKERQIVLKEKKVSEQSVSQKKRLLQGLVKDEQGNPIIGASIQLKNTGTGVITDLDGLFQIQVTDKNSVIVISYIGYVTQEISFFDNCSVERRYEVTRRSCSYSIWCYTEKRNNGWVYPASTPCRIESSFFQFKYQFCRTYGRCDCYTT